MTTDSEEVGRAIRASRHAVSIAAAIGLGFGCALPGPNAMLATAAKSPHLAVIDLRVESLPDPAYIATAAPRFSWRIAGPQRGTRQTAYRIRIGELHTWPAASAFDSGKIVSAASTLVEIAAPALAPGRTYVASVQVWDQELDDATSALSKPIEFTVAPDDTMWSRAPAVWDGTEEPNNYALFRDRITVPEDARKVSLYVACNSAYRLHLNGDYLGAGPARSDLRQALLYNAFDLTARAAAGPNTVAIEAHYLGAQPRGPMSGLPCLRTLLVAELDNGELSIRGSDPGSTSFKVLAKTPRDESAPIRGPAFGRVSAVERYDAALAREIGDWTARAYDDSGWVAPSTEGVPVYPLLLQSVPIREEEALLPIAAVRQSADGTKQTIDVGYLTTGWPTLRFRNTQPGDVIRIEYSDRVDANGRIVPGDGQEITDNYDEFIAAGGPIETWSPHYWDAFQYFEITGLRTPLQSEDVTITRVNTPLRSPRIGFASSDDLLNRIYAISRRTQLACTHGLFMDTPQRERTQYFADGFIEAMNVAYAFEDPLVWPKMLRDARAFEAVAQGGFVPASWPTDSASFIAEWSLHYPIAVWKRYQMYGDRRALEENYSMVVDAQQLFEFYRDSQTGLLTGMPGIADWPLAQVNSACATRTSLNAFYYGTLRALESMATELGRPTEAFAFGNLASEVRQQINARLFNGTDRYLDCLGEPAHSQISSVFALHFDVVPDTARPAVLAFIKSRGFDTETYGGYYLTDVMMRYGEAQWLFEQIQDRTSLWAQMVELGSSTAWEGWVRSGSLCHAFTAYPLKFLKQMTGLDPLAPGWERIRMRPALIDGIERMRATIPTPRGVVSGRWEQLNDGAVVQVGIEVPGNTTAAIELPRRTEGILLLDGEKLIGAGGGIVGPLPRGVSHVDATATGFEVEVGSGVFEFELR